MNNTDIIDRDNEVSLETLIEKFLKTIKEPVNDEHYKKTVYNLKTLVEYAKKNGQDDKLVVLAYRYGFSEGWVARHES